MLQPAKKYTDKILIIDADPVLRKKVIDYLEDSGFEMIQADNGKAGLELFRAEKPDLVLASLQLPGMNGLEVLEALAKGSPQTPVLISAETASMKEVIEALRLGASDYIAKPILDFAVLEHVLCKALERSRLVEENRRYREQLEILNQALKKNLKILEEDQEAGRSVQMRMLPEQNFNFDPYYFSHAVVPSLYLSGDFIDYFKIDEERMGFYIVDVSGHGASSAFVTVLVKSLIGFALTRFQSQEDTTILEPEELLAMLGREIYGAKLGKYLTIVYGVLDRQHHTLQYSIGGHYPNPLWKAGNDVRFLEGKGFPVGIMNAAVYQTHTLDIPKDFEMLMFSDGVLEILKAPDLPAKEKLLLSLVQETPADLGSFLNKLNLVADQKGLPDDITMLMIKRS